MTYSKSVNLESRSEMVAFLKDHFRYNTANSWNKSTSFAHNMKIHNLPLTKDEKDALYDIRECEGAYDEVNDLIHIFDVENDFTYQAGFNGRSGGYLVLYSGGKQPSGYKSYCAYCGQLNYQTASGGAVCGVCGEERKNFDKTHMQTFSYPGQSIGDEYYDEDEWDDDQIRELIKVVQRFDQLADDIVECCREMTKSYEADTIEVSVPKTVRVLKQKGDN